MSDTYANAILLLLGGLFLVVVCLRLWADHKRVKEAPAPAVGQVWRRRALPFGKVRITSASHSHVDGRLLGWITRDDYDQRADADPFMADYRYYPEDNHASS